MSVGVVLSTALMLCACSSNNYLLEVFLTDSSSGAPSVEKMLQMHLVCNVLFVTLESILFCSRPRAQVALLRHYAILGTATFLVHFLHFKAYSEGVNQPLHAMLRSSSLVFGAIVGRVAFARRYSNTRIAACCLVSAGLALVVNASVNSVNISGDSVTLQGCYMVLVAMLVTSVLGQLQENGHRRFGKRPREELLWTYLFASLFTPLLATSEDESFVVEMLDRSTKKALGLYFVSYYACARGFYLVFEYTDILTATLFITLRKFASVVFSVYYFGHSWNLVHAVAACLVYSGTMLYIYDSSKKNEAKSQ